MNISAADKSTGKSNKITITNDKGRLSKEDIEDMIKKAEKFKEEDDANKEKIEKRNSLENFLYNLKNNISSQNSDNNPKLAEIKDEIDPIIKDGLDWLEENPSASSEDYDNKQKEIESKTNPLMTKLYQDISPENISPDMNENQDLPPQDDLD